MILGISMGFIGPLHCKNSFRNILNTEMETQSD
jgi:hypothetical protein